MDSFQDTISQFLQDQPILSAILITLGSFVALRFAHQTLAVLLQVFLLPGVSLTKFGAKSGAWAVITGASDGIGKEFAFQLARAGFNVLLVARNQELLTSTAEAISQACPAISTATHSIDFALQSPDAWDALEASFAGKDISILVNNVGKSHAMPAYLPDVPPTEIADILSINVNATVRITTILLPRLLSRKGRGLVLNIGSFAGMIPSPMLAAYSASKAFLATWSAALHEEMRGKNVLVQHVNTYFVVSKLSKIRRPTLLIPTPRAYVASVLSKLGLPCGAVASPFSESTTTPYWSHALLDYGLTVLNVPGLAIRYTHWLHRDIRRRALAKKDREERKRIQEEKTE